MKKEKTKTTTSEPIAEADRVPLKEKLAYGIGGLMDGGGVSMMSCVMLAYLTARRISQQAARLTFLICITYRSSFMSRGSQQRRSDLSSSLNQYGTL